VSAFDRLKLLGMTPMYVPLVRTLVSNVMLDGGMGFSLVPWKPVIHQQLAATARGGGVSRGRLGGN